MTSSVVGPSGRPGVERALADLIEPLLPFNVLSAVYREEPCEYQVDDGEGGWETVKSSVGYLKSDDRKPTALRVAAAIVAAIPSLDAEALAELTGGEVEDSNGCTHDCATGVDLAPLGPDKLWRCDICGAVYRQEDEDKALEWSRVVTPWRSVTSPEENR